MVFSQKKSISGSQSVGRGPQGGTQQLQGRDGGMVVVVVGGGVSKTDKMQ